MSVADEGVSGRIAGVLVGGMWWRDGGDGWRSMVSVVAGRDTIVVVDGARWESWEGLRPLTQPGNDFGNETAANR